MMPKLRIRPTRVLGAACAAAFVAGCGADPNASTTGGSDGAQPIETIETIPAVTAPPTTEPATTGGDVESTVDAPEPTVAAQRPVTQRDLGSPLPLEGVDAGMSERLATVQLTGDLVTTEASAVDLVVRPGDPALFVVEHDGRVIRHVDGESSVVADISARLVDHRNEQGLTGLEFSADGSFAWLHSTTPAGETTISEVPVADDGMFDVERERVIIDVGGPPGINHNSGDMLLAPDGTLLITLGDGDAGRIDEDGNRGPASDPYRFAQDPSTLRGSLLRIRPTPGVGAGYVIPEDNPFADGPIVADDGRTIDGLPEVFAWGLRNPWKIALDTATGALWISDVGGNEAEEINLALPDGGGVPGAGLDFGWSRFEGTLDRNPGVEPVLDDPVAPVFAYPHEGLACAISGGEVYRGDAIPELQGGYVFADFCEGSVRLFDPFTRSARRVIGNPDGGGIAGLSGIRSGPDGELYAISWFGEVFRLVSR